MFESMSAADREFSLRMLVGVFLLGAHSYLFGVDREHSGEGFPDELFKKYWQAGWDEGEELFKYLCENVPSEVH